MFERESSRVQVKSSDSLTVPKKPVSQVFFFHVVVVVSLEPDFETSLAPSVWSHNLTVAISSTSIRDTSRVTGNCGSEFFFDSICGPDSWTITGGFLMSVMHGDSFAEHSALRFLLVVEPFCIQFIQGVLCQPECICQLPHHLYVRDVHFSDHGCHSFRASPFPHGFSAFLLPHR